METLEEFKKRTQKVNGPRIHKITNSYGVYDGFKYYRKNRPSDKKYVLNESTYFAIIRKVNELFAEELLRSSEINFPLRMGGLEIRKRDVSPRIDENGKLKYSSIIDWDATLEERYNDPNSKVIIKRELRQIYRTRYNSYNANFQNKTFYQFTINKDLKRRMSQLIRQGKLDAFKSRDTIKN